MKAGVNKMHSDFVKSIIFHRNNTNTGIFGDEVKTATIGWEILNHLPYSSDIAHSYRNFIYKILFMTKIQFPGRLQKHREQFFAEKDEKFCKNGFIKLYLEECGVK